MRFEYHTILWFAILIPFTLFGVRYIVSQNYKLLNRWKNVEVLLQITTGDHPYFSSRYFFILGGLLTLGILALANPQYGIGEENLQSQNNDIYVVLDISNSMNTMDISPSRLIKSKKYAVDLIEKLKGNNYCIVLFAGSSYVQMPMTADYAAAIMMINAISTDYAGTQGTNIDDAFNSVKKMVDKRQNSKPYIFLITDGEDHENASLDIEENLVIEGATVYCIAAGTSKGGPIPDGNSYKKDEDGTTIISKVNEELINNIAKKGNGRALSVEDYHSINTIVSDVELGSNLNSNTKSIKNYVSYFQWLIGLMILILIADWYYKINNKKGLK